MSDLITVNFLFDVAGVLNNMSDDDYDEFAEYYHWPDRSENITKESILIVKILLTDILYCKFSNYSDMVYDLIIDSIISDAGYFFRVLPHLLKYTKQDVEKVLRENICTPLINYFSDEGGNFTLTLFSDSGLSMLTRDIFIRDSDHPEIYDQIFGSTLLSRMIHARNV